MESKYKLKEIVIKSSTYCYLDDIINAIYINFNDILLDEKLYENTSSYEISYKTL